MKAILYILLALLLSSCGLFRKIHKEKTLNKSEFAINTKSDSTGITIDKSVITTKEKVDTVITLPGKSIKQDVYLNMDSLINGMTAVKNDLLDVRLVLNPLTNTLSVVANLKPRKVPVVLDKQITTHNDITQSGAKSELRNEKSKESQETGVLDKQPKNTSWYAIIILGSCNYCVCGLSVFQEIIGHNS